MKSKKNLTRFTYETAAFQGWRLCISRAGSTFTRYFPDKKFGGEKQSLEAAEKTLESLKAMLDSSKRISEKVLGPKGVMVSKDRFSGATLKKAEKLLAEAV
jgi:hypothetical protein